MDQWLKRDGFRECCEKVLALRVDDDDEAEAEEALELEMARASLQMLQARIFDDFLAANAAYERLTCGAYAEYTCLRGLVDAIEDFYKSFWFVGTLNEQMGARGTRSILWHSGGVRLLLCGEFADWLIHWKLGVVDAAEVP